MSFGASIEQFDAVMPFYLALDMSAAAGPWSEHYESGLKMLQECASTQLPVSAASQLAVGAMTGGGASWTQLAPAPDAVMPTELVDYRGTRLESTFRSVRGRIDADLSLIRSVGWRCYRPALVVLLAAPVGSEDRWQPAFTELTYYDSARRSGFARYPAVIPFSLSPAVDRVLEQLVHPAGVSRSYRAEPGHSPAEQVAHAFGLIADLLCTSVRTLPSARPQHVMPSDSRRLLDRNSPGGKSSLPPNRNEPSVHQAPPSAHRDGSGPGGRSSLVGIRCSRDGSSTVGTFRENATGWQLERSRAVDVLPPGMSAARQLTGAFSRSPEFAGCARCGNLSIVKCRCGQLGCWDEVAATHYCWACRASGRIEGRITDIQGID